VVENGGKNGREVHDVAALGKADHKQLTPVRLHQPDLQVNTTMTHRHIHLCRQQHPRN